MDWLQEVSLCQKWKLEAATGEAKQEGEAKSAMSGM